MEGTTEELHTTVAIKIDVNRIDDHSNEIFCHLTSTEPRIWAKYTAHFFQFSLHSIPRTQVGTVLMPILQMWKLKLQRGCISRPRSLACWSRNRTFSADLSVSWAQWLCWVVVCNLAQRLGRWPGAHIPAQALPFSTFGTWVTWLLWDSAVLTCKMGANRSFRAVLQGFYQIKISSDVLGGLVAKTPCSQCRESGVQFLVSELDPTCWD